MLFVAFGTRGDVQPLLLLANSLKGLALHVRFITHEAHTRALDFSSVDLICVQSDPLRPPEASSPAAVCDEYAPLIACCARARPSILIYNLFSMGAWHIAERHKVPSVVVSPCLIPYEHPASFSAEFAALHTELNSRLLKAMSDEITWNDVTHW